MELNQLEKKAWFRALKVLYIGLFLIITIVIGFWGYSFKPYQSVDPLSSTITCDNGIKRRPTSSSVLIFEDGTLGYSEDLEVKKLCMDQNSFEAKNGAVPVDKNYTVQVGYKISGSWITPLEIWVIGFGSIFVLFETIKRIFLYIAIGKKFF